MTHRRNADVLTDSGLRVVRVGSGKRILCCAPGGGGRVTSTQHVNERAHGRKAVVTGERRSPSGAPRWMVHTVGGRWLRVRTFRAGTDPVVGDPTARIVLDVASAPAEAEPVWVSMTAEEARELAAELFARSEELDPPKINLTGGATAD